METEELLEEGNRFGLEKRPSVAKAVVPVLGKKKSCSQCSDTEKFSKKLAALSYDYSKQSKQSLVKDENTSWSLFECDDTGIAQSYSCISAQVKLISQKQINVGNKPNQKQINAPARRRRFSDFSRRGKREDEYEKAFVLLEKGKEYMKNYRREKIAALTKTMLEDEMKWRLEDVAAALPMRRRLITELPENIESDPEMNSTISSVENERKESLDKQKMARSHTTMFPVNSLSDSSSVGKVISDSRKSSTSQDKQESSSMTSFQEYKLSSDASKKKALSYQKSGDLSSPLLSIGKQPNTQSSANNSKSSMGKNNTVAKVFDVASFIMDRDLLRK